MITPIRKIPCYITFCTFILAVIGLSGCATSSVNRAIAQKDHERALELVHKGKGIDEKDAAGRTPLHNAAAIGDSELVAALLEQGADANASTNKDVRPLHNATVSSQLDVETIKLLLNHGADPNVQNKAGATPLIFAAGQDYDPAKADNHVQIVEQLLHAGADPNIENEDNRTAIHYAAYRGRPLKVLELLLENGANPRHRALKGGISPLIQAAANDQRDAFNLLADAGATPHITVNEDLAERSDKNKLQVDLTFENNARTYSMYGDWLREKGEISDSYTYYFTAAEYFSLAAKEYNRASEAYTSEIPNAKTENVGRVIGSIFASVLGVAMAATTGHGFVSTPNLTNKAELYEKETQKYTEKAIECSSLAETTKDLATDAQQHSLIGDEAFDQQAKDVPAL